MNGRKQKKRGFHRWPRHHALPPHSWESQPAAKQGEVNKRLVVIIISIVAVVLLLLLLFFGAKFVGKAIALPSGTGGATSTLAIPQAAGTEILVPIGVNLPATKKSVAFELELKYSPEILKFVRLDSLVPWDGSFQRVVKEPATVPATVRFERATLNFTDAIQGNVVLVEAVFHVRPGQQLTSSKSINITTLNVIDLDNSNVNLVQNIVQLSGQINPAVAEPTLAFDFTAEGTLALSILLPLEKNISGWYFELMSPPSSPDNTPAVNICAGNIIQFPWNEFPEQGCVDGILRAGDATLTNFKAEAVTLAELTFPLPAAGTSIIFNFQKMDVYDQNGQDLFPAGQVFTVTVPTNLCAGKSCPPQTTTCADSFIASCPRTCNPANGQCRTCTPSCAGHECVIGQTLCDGSCINAQTNNNNCGSCGKVCPAGQLCQSGQCLPPPPETCDGLDNDGDSLIDEGNVCPFTITSSAFRPGGDIPDKYTCNGLRYSPPLNISNLPEGTTTVTVIMEDTSIATGIVTLRHDVVHWSLLNIPVPAGAKEVTLAEQTTAGSTTAGLLAANDITGQKAYAAPCPPAEESHQYRFRAYALNSTVTLNQVGVDSLTVNQVEAKDVVPSAVFEDRMQAIILPRPNAHADLVGYYYPRPPTAAEPGGGRGGGFSCSSVWSCPSQWSLCNATLQQARECVDRNRCEPKELTRIEVQSCPECLESWICSEWSACTAGQQYRKCVDEHACRTYTREPASQKGCQVALPPGPPPVRITPQIQPPLAPPPAVQQPAPPAVPLWLRIWQNYKTYVVAVPSALLVVITLILLIHHFRKPKVVYNVEELKGWIKAEKAMGTSDENVKAILAQNTGWSKEEIETALQDALGVSPETSPGASPALPPAMPPTS